MNTIQLSLHINYVIVAYMQFLWHENEQTTMKIILKGCLLIVFSVSLFISYGPYFAQQIKKKRQALSFFKKTKYL